MRTIKKIPRNAYFLLIALLFFGNFIFSIYPANSAITDYLSGYAWSENIGWLSLNCSDGGTCASADYGVHVDTSGNISGYAWSENIGWVSFNASDVAGCPTGTCAPHFDNTTGKVTGWAKVLSSATAGDSTWDGFISLSGSGYGVTVSNCAWSGWAWGSSVVGWISFSGSGYGVTGNGTACVVTAGICTGALPTNASACVAGDPLSDTPFAPVPSCGSSGITKCNYTCNSGYIADGGTCRVAACNNGSDDDGDGSTDLGDAGCTDVSDDDESAGICTGALPTNASACVAGDPLSDTPFASVPSCSFSGITKCNYTCNSGYIADGGTCRVAACNNGSDDDGDGSTDLGDAGCTDVNDDDEENSIVDPELTTSKRVVTIGDTVTVNWNTGGVPETMCILTANGIEVTPNVFTADDGPSDLPFEGTTTQVVRAHTIFEINCGGRVDSQQVEATTRMFET